MPYVFKALHFDIFALACGIAFCQFEIFEPVLKPGVFRPFPNVLREIVATIQAAVYFALQQYQLPVAQLVRVFVDPVSQIRNST